MTDKPKLEPCPWCKAYLHMSKYQERVGVELYNHTSTCFLKNFIVYPETLSLEQFQDMWNTRTKSDFEKKARELLEKISLRLWIITKIYPCIEEDIGQIYDAIIKFLEEK